MKKFIFIVLLLSTSRVGGQPSGPSRSATPNILLILSDDHSVPFLGIYGNKDLKTPHLDGLARRGVLFQRAYTAAPQCVPSRASILTGRNVVDIRMSRFSAPLPRQAPTIPEFLASQNYYSGICGRPYHLDGSEKKPEETVAAFEKYNLVTFPNRVDYLNSGPDDKVLGQFKEFLNQVPNKKPFFMWMNFSDPHRPFTADAFEPGPKSLEVPKGMPDTEEVRKDLAQHYGEIMRLDKHVGEVLRELENRNIAQNTIVIFMGDNGAALLRGKGTLYDVGLHVPLIVAGPGVEKGISTDAMVSGIDIAPTILALAGGAKPAEMTGQSFLPALKGERYDGHEYVFAARVPHSSGLPVNTAYFDLSRTVFNKKYKLIYNALWQLPYSPVDFGGHPMWKDLQGRKQGGKLEEKFSRVLFSNPRSMFVLYDLEKDPYEMNNLSGQTDYAETEHRLKAKLHEWMIVSQDYLPLPIPPK
ncbi:sulfatase family protein [Persicitalea jodogahamensis]|uniref:Heparan N-sulfatase n=1 Tax=Persicitalea jodogahamensis TaxID=402147 RepID=A0A8J3D7R7_9BACT|nr:sulfatase [Persicitalea jodogahamensis]GHB86774.1 heparan N-sulfatase [Persicitalea jodogahamensis]